MAGVSPETWWRWEKRGQKPKEADVVERFAKGFGLEADDVMWAAGLLIEDSAEDADPRMNGLNPNDPVVAHIMRLEVDEEMRGFMLDRRRQQIAQRNEQDIREIEFWANKGRGAA